MISTITAEPSAYAKPLATYLCMWLQPDRLSRSVAYLHDVLAAKRSPDKVLLSVPVTRKAP